jgi:hypothetical protein
MAQGAPASINAAASPLRPERRGGRHLAFDDSFEQQTGIQRTRFDGPPLSTMGGGLQGWTDRAGGLSWGL